MRAIGSHDARANGQAGRDRARGGRMRALGVVMALALSSGALGQVTAETVVDSRPAAPVKPRATLPSERYGLDDAAVPLLVAPAPDMPRVREEDEQVRRSGDRRLRMGIERPIWVSPGEGGNGRWDGLAGGGRVWRAEIASPGAAGLRVHLMKLRLPPGSEMHIYPTRDPSARLEPLTTTGAAGFGGAVWAPTCFGDDRVRIEYYEPAGKPGAPQPLPFLIDAVQHIYRDPARELAERGLTDRVGGCHQDVTCQSGWGTVALAVGGVGSVDAGSQVLCTGQLLATTSSDLTPYFLTANHCVPTVSAAASAEVYWRYQTSACNGAPPTLASLSRSWPCTLVSGADVFAGTDYSLLMIDGTLPSGLAWVGWLTGQQPNGTASACVHHPDGSFKRIAFGNKAAGQVCGSPAYAQADWTSGGTEVGSSGSGLFRVSDKRLYGHLSCGQSACVGSASNGLNDDFGRFDLTYAAIGSAVLDAGGDDPFEPNNSCAVARAIAAGVFENLVVKSTSEDWYSFTLGPGQSISVALSLAHAHGDVDVQLFTTCGGSAVAQSVSVSDSEQINWTNTNGSPRTVYVRVYLFSDTRNDYTMAISVSGIPNNTCANAPAIALDSPVTGTTVGATADGSAGCGSPTLPNTAPDVWYSFTPATSDVYRFDSVGSALDTVVSLHTACPGSAANQVGCNDDAGGSQGSRLDVNLSAGITYYVRVAGYNQLTGAYTLRVTIPVLPPNDSCSGASPIGDGFTQFSTIGATTDGPNEPALCNFFADPAIAADIWFRYTATCDGVVDVDTCAGGGSLDTELAVYGSDCPTAGGSVIACNDDNPAVCGNFRSAISFPARAGGQYLIRVGGFGGATGAGWLSVTCSPGGACCDIAGSCSVTAQAQCAGSWVASGSCEPSACDLPGACCDAYGCCASATLVQCPSGSWMAGTPCIPTPCSPPPGACCLSAAGCIVTSACTCTGTFIPGATCEPDPCPPMTGACCFGASCRISTPAECAGPNTMFSGPQTACGAPAGCCRGDFNQSGPPPSVQDIFDFLSAYFSGEAAADANDSGSISVQDIFDFLAAYFAGC